VLALKQAIDAVVKKDGNNALTRAAVLEALGNIHRFDANGMITPIDLGARRFSGCGVIMQIRNQEFTRVHPKKPGTFACAPGNVQTVKLDLLR